MMVVPTAGRAADLQFSLNGGGGRVFSTHAKNEQSSSLQPNLRGSASTSKPPPRTQTYLMGSKCHRRLARSTSCSSAHSSCSQSASKIPPTCERSRARSRSCSSPTANRLRVRDRRTGVIFSGRPPLLLSHACVSICLSISRPCRGHSCPVDSRPDLSQRGGILIGPNRRKNEFPLEEKRSATAFGRPRPRYHSLENAPLFCFG